jgi:ribosomal protein S18 acetylase RimI-like enzyme
MDMIIEKATPEDASALIEVQNLSFQEDFEKYGECPSYRESPENMLDMIQTVNVYKILVDNKIVGDVIVRKREDGSYYLRTIAVIPAYQNSGIGTKIIESIEKDHPGGKYWRLVTPAKSYRNRHFYEKLGYKKVGEHPHSECLTLIEYQKTL